jgi:imidazoleglycerol-phosphate dehydratase
MTIREGYKKRATSETSIECSVKIDGKGKFDVETGVPFLDHMIEQLSKHSGISMSVAATGDIHIDAHHTAEDVGIVLGAALKEALGNCAGIKRYGSSIVPMDETLVMTGLDISGRPYNVYDGQFPSKQLGTFETECVPEFMRGFSMSAGLTLHTRVISGTNTHHMIEASFKGLAVALREAVEHKRDYSENDIPSTKGVL